MQNLCVAAVYYGAAEIGLVHALDIGAMRVVRPQMGVAVAALLLLGLRVWPGVALGSFCLNLLVHDNAAASLGIAFGSTIGVVSACLLLKRTGFRNQLDRLQDAIALVVVGALVSAAVSASVGVLLLAGLEVPAAYGTRWLAVWMGSAIGVLLLAPFLLTIRHPRLPPGASPVEAAGLLVVTVVVMALVSRSSISLLFLAYPLLIWAALRFQALGAATCSLLTSAVALYAASHGWGIFAGEHLISNLILIHAFMWSTTLTALVLAAIIAERNRARVEIECAAGQLYAAVEKLDQCLRPPGLPPQRPPTRGPRETQR
nr:MASE1 domain-containing protein [Actinopolymorpha pittospori]